MKFSKKIGVGLISLILAVSMLLAGCGKSSVSSSGAGSGSAADGSSAANKEATVIKVGHVVSGEAPYNLAAEKLKELIEAKTEGRYILEIYPNGQIGSERDLVEGVQMGSVGMCIVATAPVANFVPELNAVEIPFLIRDTDHADRVFTGEIGKELAEKVSSSAQVKCLGFWENGFRSLATKGKKVEKVEDIKGIKIRTMENASHQALWKALGADPVPMAWGDAYTAVQQGALDGLENAITLIYSLKVAEITDYLAVTEHMYSPSVVLMNSKIWDEMNEEDKAIFEEAFKEAGTYERKVNREQVAKAVEGLKEQGMEVSYPDKQTLIKATEGVRKELSKDYPDLIKRIEAE